MDGKFELIITENAILNISYIGFSDKQITVKEETSLQVTMTEDTQKLDEIVVVGYGVQKKVNLTGSVSAVKGEELSQRPVANATQSLQGFAVFAKFPCPRKLKAPLAPGRPELELDTVNPGTNPCKL